MDFRNLNNERKALRKLKVNLKWYVEGDGDEGLQTAVEDSKVSVKRQVGSFLNSVLA